MTRLLPLTASGTNKEIARFLVSSQVKTAPRLTLITLIIINLFFVLSTPVSAQISPLANSGSAGFFADTSTLVEEKLVELALKGPQYNISNNQIRISEQQLSKAKKSWLNLLTISLNYNDQTFAKSTTTTPYVYPKYYFGLTIPIGTIFSLGPDINIAKENVKVTHSNQEQLARTIRADVLTKYKQYKTYNQLIAIHSVVINDEQAALAQAEKKFANGELTIELYNSISKQNNEELSKLISLQLQRELTKIEVEKLIGVRLESAIEQALQPPPAPVPEKPR